jgi:hypothetical protein
MKGKTRLWDMSWKEAKEAFELSDMVILPVGTLHGHGPTPISVDASSVQRLGEDLAARTGVMVLPVLTYGENEKQKFYPGSIAISPQTLEQVYLDIFASLARNHVRKVVVLNGHGGNREALLRAGRAAQAFGVLVAILEWWNMDDLSEKRGSHIAELAVALAIGGKEIADIRPGEGYKGEWGDTYTMRHLLGEEIEPLGFDQFQSFGCKVLIPMDAWKLDLEGPPVLDPKISAELRELGLRALEQLVEKMTKFVSAFRAADTSAVLGHVGDVQH